MFVLSSTKMYQLSIIIHHHLISSSSFRLWSALSVSNTMQITFVSTSSFITLFCKSYIIATDSTWIFINIVWFWYCFEFGSVLFCAYIFSRGTDTSSNFIILYLFLANCCFLCIRYSIVTSRSFDQLCGFVFSLPFVCLLY